MKRSESANSRTNSGSSSSVAARRCPRRQRRRRLQRRATPSGGRAVGCRWTACWPRHAPRPRRARRSRTPPPRSRAARAVSARRCAAPSASTILTPPPMSVAAPSAVVRARPPSTRVTTVSVRAPRSSARSTPTRLTRTNTNRSSPLPPRAWYRRRAPDLLTACYTTRRLAHPHVRTLKASLSAACLRYTSSALTNPNERARAPSTSESSGRLPKRSTTRQDLRGSARRSSSRSSAPKNSRDYTDGMKTGAAVRRIQSRREVAARMCGTSAHAAGVHLAARSLR